MIKVITFDLDDTLWAIAPVIDNANRRMLEWMNCLVYTSPSPRDLSTSRMPSSA